MKRIFLIIATNVVWCYTPWHLPLKDGFYMNDELCMKRADCIDISQIEYHEGWQKLGEYHVFCMQNAGKNYALLYASKNNNNHEKYIKQLRHGQTFFTGVSYNYVFNYEQYLATHLKNVGATEAKIGVEICQDRFRAWYGNAQYKFTLCTDEHKIVIDAQFSYPGVHAMAAGASLMYSATTHGTASGCEKFTSAPAMAAGVSLMYKAAQTQ